MIGREQCGGAMRYSEFLHQIPPQMFTAPLVMNWRLLIEALRNECELRLALKDPDLVFEVSGSHHSGLPECLEDYETDEESLEVSVAIKDASGGIVAITCLHLYAGHARIGKDYIATSPRWFGYRRAFINGLTERVSDDLALQLWDAAVRR
jgi:hypothetical protein